MLDVKFIPAIISLTLFVHDKLKCFLISMKLILPEYVKSYFIRSDKSNHS